MTKGRIGWRRMAAAAAMLAAGPAMADVKAGAEAWTRGDYARAVAEWRGPALAGDPDAQFNMGQAYKLGRGVPASLEQAELWYQKAAAQGHAQAQDNYGLALFQDGRKADALPWLEKSAARDEKRAELVLGTMLFNGDAVAKDWVRAYALISRSSQQEVPQASQTLAQMDGYLSPEQREQGVALATRIADQGRSAKLAAMAGTPTPASNGVTSPPVSAGSTAPGRAHAAIASVDVPPSSAKTKRPAAAHPAERGAVAKADSSLEAAKPLAVASSRPAVSKPVPSRDVAKPAALGSSRPAMASGGRWNVQLGAFREEGNAHALWAKVGGRVGGGPSFVKSAGVTRLQAGPFATKAEAERACRVAGSGCVVLP